MYTVQYNYNIILCACILHTKTLVQLKEWILKPGNKLTVHLQFYCSTEIMEVVNIAYTLYNAKGLATMVQCFLVHVSCHSDICYRLSMCYVASVSVTVAQTGPTYVYFLVMVRDSSY